MITYQLEEAEAVCWSILGKNRQWITCSLASSLGLEHYLSPSSLCELWKTKKTKMRPLKGALSRYFHISKLASRAAGFLLAFPYLLPFGFLFVALPLTPRAPHPPPFHPQNSSFCFDMACSITFPALSTFTVLGATCKQGSGPMGSLTRPGLDSMWAWEGSRTQGRNSFIVIIGHTSWRCKVMVNVRHCGDSETYVLSQD